LGVRVRRRISEGRREGKCAIPQAIRGSFILLTGTGRNNMGVIRVPVPRIINLRSRLAIEIAVSES